MNNKLILTTFIGGLLASCHTPSYTLTGNLYGFNDGDTVYLSTLDQRNFNSDGKIYKGDGFVAIDCGAGSGGKLACFCLDNGEEYYV